MAEITARAFAQAFVSGTATDDTYGPIRIEDGSLYHTNDQLYGRISNGVMGLLNSDYFATELNDALVWYAAKNDLKVVRLGTVLYSEYPPFSDDPETSNSALFLMGMSDIADDISAQIAIKNEADAKIAEYRDKVIMKVNALSVKEQELMVARQEAKLKEIYDAFDKGGPWDKNSKMRELKGEGGGLRLGLYARSDGRKVVRSSTGYELNYSNFIKAYDKVAPYIFGDKPLDGRLRNGLQSDSASYDGNEMSFNKSTVNMGCQRVLVSELRRFAEANGFPTDGSLIVPPVTAPVAPVLSDVDAAARSE